VVVQRLMGKPFEYGYNAMDDKVGTREVEGRGVVS
jgi:hypothetical protein